MTLFSGRVNENIGEFCIELNKEWANTPDIESVLEWMEENIGRRYYEWSITGRISESYLHFKYESSMVAFKLMYPKFCL